MTRPALPDFTVADDAGTLVRPPSQASRHMDLADVTALAMDRIMAASLDKAEEVFGRDQCPPDEHLYDNGCLRRIESVIGMAVETAVDRAVREYRGLPVED